MKDGSVHELATRDRQTMSSIRKRRTRCPSGWKTYLASCYATLLVTASFRRGSVHNDGGVAVMFVVRGESGTIPRSNNRYSYSSADSLSSRDQPSHHPPWNSSPKIDDRGFLVENYCRLPGEWEGAANLRGRHGPRSRNYPKSLRRVPVRVRQVPGDGNCLFHSIAACLHHAVNGTHIPMSDPASIVRLRHRSASLRQASVEVLQRSPRRRLFLQGEEYLEARELLQAAAAQFDLSGEEYCDLMKKESYWGGGPEIVALCNYLQRPIHIYELVATPRGGAHDNVDDHLVDDASSSQSSSSSSSSSGPSLLPSESPLPCAHFTLRRMACFGSPRFDRREPLHILSADSRFPDVDPRKIRKVGNHFLALFPVYRGLATKKKMGVEGGEDTARRRRHASIRGGAKIKRRRKSGSDGREGGELSEGETVADAIREFLHPRWIPPFMLSSAASGEEGESDDDMTEGSDRRPGSFFRAISKSLMTSISGF